jgi:hypothetical protein
MPNTPMQETKSAVTTEQPFDPAQDHKSRPATPPTTAERKRERKHPLDIGTFIFAVVAAVATAAAAIFAYQQGEISRDTERRQLRAYVTVDEVDIVKFDQSQPVQAHLVLKNTGQTPAYNISAITLIQPNLPSAHSNRSLDGLTLKRTRGVLGTGGVLQMYPAISRTLSDEEYYYVKNGAGEIDIFGEVTYTDAFGTLRCTRYSFSYVGSDGSHPDKLVTPTEDGNDADEKCAPADRATRQQTSY